RVLRLAWDAGPHGAFVAGQAVRHWRIHFIRTALTSRLLSFARRLIPLSVGWYRVVPYLAMYIHSSSPFFGSGPMIAV
ncbi:hypothetical protein ASPCADRAFT_209343, partial [Aspergillus carbonarius ITEM 5010]